MKVIAKVMYVSLFVLMVSSTGNLLYGQDEGFDWQESNSPSVEPNLLVDPVDKNAPADEGLINEDEGVAPITDELDQDGSLPHMLPTESDPLLETPLEQQETQDLNPEEGEDLLPLHPLEDS